MMYRSTIFCLVIMALTGISLFQVKYQVIGLESELSSLHKEIFKTEESLHLLQAEWAYLNDPQRLQVLADKHLQMDTTTPLQMVSLEHDDSNMKTPGSRHMKEPIVVKWQVQP